MVIVHKYKRSVTKRLDLNFKRIPTQEDAVVKYWFENKRGWIISMVKPNDYHPNWEVRVTTGFSTDKYNPLTIPIGDYEAEHLSPDKVLDGAIMIIKREWGK